MKPRLFRIVGLVAALALVTACGSDGGDSSTTDGGSDTTAANGDGGLSGQIIVSGSSTVEPITARVGEAFEVLNPDVATSVEGPGTGDGFVRFCGGETDISDASRAIKEEGEADVCADAGIEYVELYVAIDGLSVLTSPDNASVACLDFADLYALLGPESEGSSNWSDNNDLAAELGAGNAPDPDEPLVITAPGEESGTYDTFVEFVIAGFAEERGQEEATRADYQASANDNVIIQGISENPTSLGWVGYAFFEENADVVKALDVDGGEGCITPTPETIASGQYPLSRPLFIYVKTNDLSTKPGLVAFIDYYLSEAGIAEVSNAGYVQLTSADLDETRAAWDAAKTAAGVS
jgi:phosphate transport system substrate-binding protein